VARAIFGADRREAGEILVHGRKVTITSPKDGVAAGIGYLPKDRKHFGLALGLDLRDNMAMASLPRFGNALGVIDDAALTKMADDYIQTLAIRTRSPRQEVRLLSGATSKRW
jgi:ribose transport system ATP-binding protein